MNIINTLAISISTYEGFGMPYGLNWLGKIIQWLIDSSNSIGLGIIIFTLAIKLITLPLDIISRASMKKNGLKMKRIRPQLEKLQRQYANNKELYNKKLNAFYKQERFSPFSSCLPMIVTVVFFIIVMQQFTSYSNYTNLTMINNMSEAYTSVIVNYDKNVIFEQTEKNDNGDVIKTEYFLNENYVFENAEEFIEYRVFIEKTVSDKPYTANFKTINIDLLAKKVIELNEEGFTDILVGETDECQITFLNGKYQFNPDKFNNLTDEQMNAIVTPRVMKYLFEKYTEEKIILNARLAAKQSYKENAPSFLWIKNLWMPDLPYKHPVNPNFKDYSFKLTVQDDAQFNEITFLLDEEKSAPNGYFILVLFSVASMFLSQLIMQKTQKDQFELQSVNGQAAKTNKMMMWMMPIMFGVFSFFYSASFSLYMTISTLVSMISTFVINYFVEKSFKKKYDA